MACVCFNSCDELGKTEAKYCSDCKVCSWQASTGLGPKKLPLMEEEEEGAWGSKAWPNLLRAL